MTWRQRFERMKKHYNWTNEDIAMMIGNTPDSIRVVVSRDEFPRWLRLAILVFEHEMNLL